MDDIEEVQNVNDDIIEAISIVRDDMPEWDGHEPFDLRQYALLIEVAKMVQKERHFLHFNQTALEE